MNSTLKKLPIVVAITAAFGITSVGAQQAAAETDGLQKVVVTAAKRSQLATDVPISLQAISPDQLKNENINTFAETIQLVPGASQTFKAAPGFEVLQIRGVSSGALGDSLVGYYIDEIPFGLPNTQFLPPINVFDVSRVEVLRGPQGTLYGQSSMGGAIRLLTKRPNLKKFEAAVAAGYSSIDGGFSGRKLDVLLNVPVQENVFAVRLSAGANSEESYVANTGSVKGNNVRLKGLLNVSQDLEIEGTAWAINSNQPAYYYGLPASPYTSPIALNEPRGVDTKVRVGNITVKYDAGFGDIVSATSFLGHQLAYQFSLPGLRDLFPGAGGWLNTSLLKTQVTTQEIRVASKPESEIGWIGGLFLQDARISQNIRQGWANYASFGLGPSVYTAGNNRLTSESVGVFGEISKEFFDKQLVPTVGVRYYHDNRKSNGITDGTADNASRTFSSFNPRFNLAFKPMKDQLYYINIAKGFRSGAFQDRLSVQAANAAGLEASRLLPQDSLWSYEAGLKWEASKSLAFEAAVYYIDWKDAQITNLLLGANGVTTSIISGGTDVRGRGVDLGLTWATPLKGLALQLSGNVNKTEFQKVAPRTVGILGAQIPGAPKTTGTAALSYKTDIDVFKFSSNLSYSYRDSQKEITTGNSSESIRDLKFRIGIGQKDWDASIYGTNLTNQKGIAAVLSAAVVNAIQPRKFGVDVSYKY